MTKHLSSEEARLVSSAMSSARPVRRLHPEGPALHGRAADDLAFIRETMERAGTFTAVPGKGGIVMGAIGCAGAVAATMQATTAAWLAAWLATATAAVVAGAVALTAKSRDVGEPAIHGVRAKFVRSLLPPLVAGALLTAALWRAGLAGALPGTWLLLYGTGLMTAGAFSARIVPAMGACFMALGAAAFASPAAWGDLWMAFGFGGLHMGFGFWIWRRNGG
jgi:hypothetical protein